MFRDPKNVNTKTGEVLSRLRKRRGMTREYVAKQLGISPQQLWKYESGSSSINLCRLLRLSEVFSIAPKDIITVIAYEIEKEHII